MTSNDNLFAAARRKIADNYEVNFPRGNISSNSLTLCIIYSCTTVLCLLFDFLLL